MARIVKPLRFIICIGLVMGILAMGGVKLYQLGREFLGFGTKGLEKIATIEMDNSNNEKKQQLVTTFKGEVAVYNNNSLKLYNLMGEEKWSLGQKMEKPILKSSENMIFLADKSTGFINAIDEHGMVLWTLDAAQPLGAFVCNPKGSSVVVKEKENGGGDLLIYDSKGKNMGKVDIKKGTIMDVAITNDGGMVAVSLLSTEKDKIETNVILYSKEGRLLGGNKYDDEIMAKLFFSHDNKLISVGTSHIVGFDKSKGLLWSKAGSNSVNKLAWNGLDLITVNYVNSRKSLLDTKDQNLIVMYNLEGEKLLEISMKDNIEEMAAINRSVAILTNRTMYYMKEYDQEIIEKKINNDIKGVSFLSDHQLLIITEGKIDIMQIN